MEGGNKFISKLFYILLMNVNFIFETVESEFHRVDGGVTL